MMNITFHVARLDKILESTLAPLVPGGLLSQFVINQLSLKIEHDPCWRMVAGVRLSPRPSVYATVHEPVRHLRRE
jgi:hypothetical protein